MGQPDLSKREARLLECLQEKKSLTGWPSAIANIARINTNGLNYARRNLSDHGFIREENMTDDSGDGTHVIKLSVTERGMRVLAVADDKTVDGINSDIKDLITDIGYTQSEIAKELGMSRTTLIRKLSTVLSETSRRKLVSKIRQVCQ